MLAALEKPQSFTGGSQLKTWLVGILKHKLIDQLRRHTREIASSPDDDSELEDLVFAPDGHFRDREQDWGNPESALGERQFFVVLQACVNACRPGGSPAPGIERHAHVQASQETTPQAQLP